MRIKLKGKYNDHKPKSAAVVSEDLGEPSLVILSKNGKNVNTDGGGGCPVRVGDRVQFIPDHLKFKLSAHNTFYDSAPITGEVVAVFPRRRYYRVVYHLGDGSLCHESFKF